MEKKKKKIAVHSGNIFFLYRKTFLIKFVTIDFTDVTFRLTSTVCVIL